MSLTLASAIKAVLQVQKKVTGVVQWIESPPASMVARLEATERQVILNVAQTCGGVCRALIAHAIDQEPTSDEVNRFLDAATQDQSFPHRIHRLLGEMKKSADQRRRRFLAAMLFGLSFDVLPDDQRDRVDMAVERLMPEDVEILLRVSDVPSIARLDSASELMRHVFGESNVVTLILGTERRLATIDDWVQAEGALAEAVYRDPRFKVNAAALASLVSLGCVDVGQSVVTHGEWRIHQFRLTPLGELVIRAIKEVRPGLEATL